MDRKFVSCTARAEQKKELVLRSVGSNDSRACDDTCKLRRNRKYYLKKYCVFLTHAIFFILNL